jgi:hypothetical protein
VEDTYFIAETGMDPANEMALGFIEMMFPDISRGGIL